MPVSSHYQPAPRFAALGEPFFDVVEPARFPKHVLRYRNDAWAERLGFGTLDREEWETHFARFEPLPGNLREPLALRYHGHQFLTYNPGLGDGRAFLFAQLVDPVDGRLLDLGTKGSGQTPWSRGGDGRLTLKGGVREILASEMLEALGVSTSKVLSLYETGESLYRNDEPSPTRSSVLVRIGHSHVRFGTFQRLAWHRDTDGMNRLVDYVLEHLLPDVEPGDAGSVFALFEEVVRRSADTAAAWTVAGFVHGVLNTDNMNVTGESFDYGPWRFLPVCDPRFVAAYFDAGGLYAFGRQAQVVLWNLERLAEALDFVEPAGRLKGALAGYEPAWEAALRRRLLDRLGLRPGDPDRGQELVRATFDFLDASRVGFDRFFFDWRGGAPRAERALAGPAASFYSGDAFARFRRELESFEPAPVPTFDGDDPATMLIDDVEAIWDAIAERDDWRPFAAKIEELRAMGRIFGHGAASEEYGADGASA